MALSQAEAQAMLAQFQAIHQQQMAGMQAMPWGMAGSAAVLTIGGLQAVVHNGPVPSGPLPTAGMKVEDLIGWRIWRVRNGHLWSYSADYAWMPGDVSEGVPGDHDSAGIWAFKDKRRAFQKAVDGGSGCGTSYVWGSVLLWGQVVEHADGWRASKSRILSIDGATRNVTRAELSDLCEIHGVPMPMHVERTPTKQETPLVQYGESPAYFMVPAHPIDPRPSIAWPVIGTIAVVLASLAFLIHWAPSL